MRVYFLSAAALLLAGCYPAGLKSALISHEAHKAMQAGEYKRCVELQTQASESLKMELNKKLKPLEHANVVSYSAGSQMGLADCLVKQGMKAEAGSHYERALTLTEQALGEYERLPPPSDDLEKLTQDGGRYNTQLTRALSLKASGRLAEAIAALEKAVEHANAMCHRNWEYGAKDVGRRMCETTANETEAVAKWKKELAGGKP